MSKQPLQRQFDTGALKLCAQEWGKPGAEPVLALHGWLDNCASFTPLAGLLGDVHLIALDMPGHGFSEHRPAMQPYNIWEDVREVFAVADLMGWDQFTLLGHSRGAVVSTLSAGTFPERIKKLCLIDGIVPMPAEAKEAPEQLAQSIGEVARRQKSSPPVYASIDSATNARRRGLFKLSREAARLLTERGIKAVDGGYTWSSDSRLMAASAIRLSSAHLQAFIERIEAESCLLLAEDGLKKMAAMLDSLKVWMPDLSVESFQGSHHLHMEETAEDLARYLNRFIHSQD